MPDRINDRYIGDGVYATFDGMHIGLDLRGQPTQYPHSCIKLEPSVFHELLRFAGDVGAPFPTLPSNWMTPYPESGGPS